MKWARLPYYQSSEDVPPPPEGWAVHRIDEVFEPVPKGRLYAKKECVEGGRVPVLDQSEDGVIGFHNDVPGVRACDQRPVVTFANHTCEMRWVRVPFSVIQNVFPMVGRPGVCETSYFYYTTKGRVWLEEYKGHYPDYRRAWLPLPPLDEQHRIAAVLGALDDKIELNRKMSRTLEEMAQAIFKSWFIDFDGVPDSELVKSELGPIPRGWSVKPLDQVADFLNGAACQKFRARPGEPSLPVIKIREMNQGVTAKTDRATADLPRKWYVENGDVLFSWSGSLVVKVWTGGRGALNQHLFKVTSTAYPRWFILLWTQRHLSEFQRIAADKATTMGHIKRHHLTDAKCAVPRASSLAEAGALLDPLVRRSVANELQSRTLAALRDALLPKLISGEIRVPEAEEAVEAMT